MAYDTSVPPVRILNPRDGSSPSMWAYSSADSFETVAGDDYFSNASNLGMRVGDKVMVTETDNDYATRMFSVSSVTSGAATLNADDKLAVEGGTGVVGIASQYATSVTREGGMIKTSILIDLTGLRSTASGDIIGDDGTSNPCHLGQITAARNGTLIAGRITCFEAPGGGDPDIDLFTATVATGTEDTAISGVTGQAQMVDAGDHTLGSVKILTALPAADSYLYLVAGATTNADYTGGILLIELYGV